MIRLIENAELIIQEPLFACRINAVLKCYKAINAADCFIGGGAVFCRFSSLLMQSGVAEANELFEFADFLGVRELQMLSGDMPKKTPGGWRTEAFPLLKVSLEKPESFKQSGMPRKAEDARYKLRRVYEIIAASDERFKQSTEPLMWISDISRRINAGVGEAFLLCDAAAVCVGARDERSAYISAVAVLPQHRGQGLGLAAVLSAAHKLLQEGREVYISAGEKPLIEFYKKIGFRLQEESLISIKKES